MRSRALAVPVLIGIWLLVYGLIMAITAFSLRRSAHAAQARGDMAPA